jgi:fibronectin type 3 domain-containing protein
MCKLVGLSRGPARQVFASRYRPFLEVLESRLAPSADVLTYRDDGFNTGQTLSETALTPANVNTTDFGKLFTVPLDGRMYAQPLYKQGVSITSGSSTGTHNVIFAASEHDSVYAIDADNGQTLWQDSFINPAAGVTPVPSVDVGAVVLPEIGITSTPVIDPTTNTLYTCVYTKEVRGGANHYVYRFHALDLSSGQEQFGGPLLVADTIFDGLNYTFVSGPAVHGTGVGNVGGTLTLNTFRQLQRPALTLDNGTVYVAFGSHNDQEPAHGWILGFNHADTHNQLQLAAAFNVTPNGDLGTIWQSGGKLAVDQSGFLYAMIGNGTFDTTLDANGFPVNGDYGDTFVKLAVDSSSSPTNQNKNGWGLKVVDYFAPHNVQTLTSTDLDIGSGAPLLLPDSAGSPAHPHLLVGGGKAGTLYLIDRDNMGKFNPSTDNIVQELPGLYQQGIWGPAAYFNGTVYVAGSVPTLNAAAITLAIQNGQLSAHPVSLSQDLYGFEGSVPSISANGSADGIIWNLDHDSSQLRAYDATSYSGLLYTSAQAAKGRDSSGMVVKFTTPTVANGRVYVGATQALVAYGLLGSRMARPAAPTGLTATAVSGNQVSLVWKDNSDNEDRFEIQLSLDGTTFTPIGTAGINATSYFVSGLQSSAAYTFRVRAINRAGVSAYSNFANVSTGGTATTIGFDLASGFAKAVGAVVVNGSAKVNGSQLQLTDGGPNEAGSAFFGSPINTAQFTTQFGVQLANASADGLTFTLQGTGTHALGTGGAGLGYQGIANSLAIKFDLFSNSGEGPDSTGLYADGALPTSAGSIDLSPTGVDLHSGHVFRVTLSYDGAVLRSMITDTVTNSFATQAYPVDIPAILGSGSAYAGFTGADDSQTSVENIVSWTYASPSITAAAPGNLTAAWSNGGVVLHWDASPRATGYSIFRSTGPGGEGSTPLRAGLTGTTFTDTSLAGGTTYYYQVAASNFGGESVRSNEASALTAPAPPSGTAAVAGGSQIGFNWQASFGATSYNIYRSPISGGEGNVPYRTQVTTTSFTDPGLLSGVTFYYKVTAVNAGGESAKSAEASATVLPAGPTALTAKGATGKIVLLWQAAAGAVTYNLYRALSPGQEGKLPFQSNLNGTSFTDVGLSSGTTYYYRVTAVNAGGESVPSSEAAATTAAVPPIGVTATAMGTEITLSWTGSTGAASYNIYRATTPTGEGSIPYRTQVTSTSFADPGLLSGATFYYQVTAVNAGGESAKSAEASATVLPAGPTALTAKGATGKIVLLWQAAAGAVTYNLYRALSPGQEGKLPFQSNLNGTSFTDVGLSSGTTYYYRVTAVNAGGESVPSNEAVATTAAVRPIGVTATAMGTEITLSWTGSTGAASYNVYRATTSGGEAGVPYKTQVATTSFTDAGLPTGATFYYEITAVNAGGESGPSGEGSSTLVPAVPTNVVAAGGQGQVNLRWDAVSGAVSYNVYRSASPGAEGTHPYKALTTPAFTDGGLTNGASFYYRITAVNAGGESGPSAEAVGFTAASPPGNISASAASGHILVTWSASSGAASYNLYRSSSPTPSATPYKLGLTSTSFLDAGLPGGATFYYEVTAINAGGESARSVQSFATLGPDAPLGLTTSTAGAGILLTWAVTPGATSYNIYRATSSRAEGTIPYSTGLTTSSFTDAVPLGSTFYYRVTAVNHAGESPPSNETLASVPFFDLSAGFVGAGSIVTLNGSAAVSGAALRLSDSLLGEASSVFSNNRRDITRFSTQFRFQLLNPQADGFTFTMQGVGPGALGPNGGGLGYGPDHAGGSGGIPNSVAVKFDLHDNQGEGDDSTGLYTDGAAPTSAGSIDLGPTGIDLHSGHIFSVFINYDGGLLRVAITDTSTQATTSQSYPIDIPATIGASTAYVGFTAATGAMTATQDILSWTFDPPILTPGTPTNVAMTPGTGQVALQWDAVAGATKYNVYRASSPGGEGNTPVAAGLPTPSYTDTGLTNGTTYYYQVAAVNSAGESGRSTEAAAPVGFVAHINFSDNAKQAAAGYIADVGLVYGDRGNGLSYGWNADNRANARDRNSNNSPDELHDSFAHMQDESNPNASWQIAVPNGTYSVHLVAGDPKYFDSVYRIDVEGVLAINGTPTASNLWLERTIEVTVTDGLLTVSNAPGSQNNKIDYIDVVQTTPEDVAANAAGGQIALSWTPSTAAASYNVYRGTTSGGEGTTPYQAGVTSASFIDAAVNAGTTYYYQVTALDVTAQTIWSKEVRATTPILDLSGGFDGSSGTVTLTGSAKVQGAILQLTDGGTNEAGSAFTAKPLDVTHFSTRFSFQILNGSADGFTFTIRAMGTAALGPAGGGLGYGPDSTGNRGGIAQSVAVKFDLYNNRGEGTDSTGIYTDGAAPTSAGAIDLASHGIDLHNGHLFTVGMNYDGTLLAVAITDTSTGRSASQSYPVSIPGTVGANMALVGFTGATGAQTATQDISCWTFSPALAPPAAPQNLTASSGVGQVDLSWTPALGASSYNVYRGISPGGEGATPVQTGLTLPALRDVNLDSGVTYYYRVTAVNLGGQSARSSEIKITMPRKLAQAAVQPLLGFSEKGNA